MTPRRRPEWERGSTAPMPRSAYVYAPETGEVVAHLYELPAIDPLVMMPARIGQAPEVAK